MALIEPEIPHNTGAAARLCVATRTPLHLVGRLGFRIDEASVRRTGLDYWKYTDLHLHESVAAFSEKHPKCNWHCFSTHAKRSYLEATFDPDAVLMFGCETKGLPASVLAESGNCWRIPILDDRVRSLNLSTAVAIVLFEALRQQGLDERHGSS